ncbi:hypothetical protein ACQR1Y_12025 [Bradyrhizobium sp. HKCCYLRH3099]|uniref:hypothetical protein n=1 Tax=unclassified Bradyrhizobium TaxID=2631580 RepID=UPI003EB861EA
MSFVDLSQVEQMLGQSRQVLQPLTAEPGAKGAQARMALALDPAFVRQLAAEVNRHTEGDDIANALAASCANMIVSLVSSAGGIEDDPDAQHVQAMRVIARIGRMIERHFDDGAPAIFDGMVTLAAGGRA